MRLSRLGIAFASLLIFCPVVSAQQRPLLTQDPETIGAGQILLEGGIERAYGQTYPASGLEGTLLRLPTLGISLGVGAIAEVQFDGGIYDHLNISQRRPAPLSPLLTFPATDTTTADVEDFFIGTKIRLAPEKGRRPAFGIVFTTRLPNARNGTGLGRDTMEFFTSVLAAKTVQSVRIVANGGFGILPDAVEGNRQNDVVTLGTSVARALTEHAEVVAEVNGRISTRDEPFAGTESRGLLNFGARYTRGPVRFDGAVYFGITSVDPTVGVNVGFTYVFKAFDVAP